jgi:DNA-directed RNA polymerase subunit F
MNRMFKTQFHNGDEGLKPIVTMSVVVNNGKKFHSLDQESKAKLVEELVSFQSKVSQFTAEIIMSMSKAKPNK